MRLSLEQQGMSRNNVSVSLLSYGLECKYGCNLVTTMEVRTLLYGMTKWWDKENEVFEWPHGTDALYWPGRAGLLWERNRHLYYVSQCIYKVSICKVPRYIRSTIQQWFWLTALCCILEVVMGLGCPLELILDWSSFESLFFHTAFTARHAPPPQQRQVNGGVENQSVGSPNHVTHIDVRYLMSSFSASSSQVRPLCSFQSPWHFLQVSWG